LIDARMNRLKLEGTPRVKRERRQPAPPISPLAAQTVFSDFLIPANGDFDFGTAAMRMLEDIRQDQSPPSPSPTPKEESEMLT
jgi:cytokinesis protein